MTIKNIIENIKESIELSILLTGVLGVIITVLCLGPLLTYFLFNYLAPIFNFQHINFFQAIALYILINILTTGFKYNGNK